MILSQPAARHQTERFIYQKRVQDQVTEKLSTKLKQEYYEKEFAAWSALFVYCRKYKFFFFKIKYESNLFWIFLHCVWSWSEGYRG